MRRVHAAAELDRFRNASLAPRGRRLPPKSSSSTGCTPMTTMRLRRASLTRASARTSLKPVWCGESFVAAPGGDLGVAQHLERAGRQTEVDRIEHEHPPRRRDVVEESEAQRAAVDELDVRRATRSRAWSASTARTPKPSSAQSTLPMPSAGAAAMLLLLRPVTPAVTVRRPTRGEPAAARDATSERWRSGHARPGTAASPVCADGPAASRQARRGRRPPRACPRRPEGASRTRRRCRRTRRATAVSGVIAPPAVDEFVTRRREMPSAAARSVCADVSGFRNRVSRNWPDAAARPGDTRGGAGRSPAARAAARERFRTARPLGAATYPCIGGPDHARGSRLNIRMPLIIVLITDSPLMMSSRNTMYMWTTANSTRYHMAKWCSVRTVCGSPSSDGHPAHRVHLPRAPRPLLRVQRETGRR